MFFKQHPGAYLQLSLLSNHFTTQYKHIKPNVQRIITKLLHILFKDNLFIDNSYAQGNTCNFYLAIKCGNYDFSVQ